MGLLSIFLIDEGKGERKLLSQIIAERQKTLDNPFWNKLVDKYEVRKVVSDKSNFKLPKLYKLITNIDEINIDDYPNNFVFKCTNGSGMVLIIKDRKIYGSNQYITNKYTDFFIQYVYKCLLLLHKFVLGIF